MNTPSPRLRDAARTRSYLFVPGTRPERFPKAIASGAHAVIVDMEDAVPPADKPKARDLIANALDAAQPVCVRVNGADTSWFEEDVRACRHPGVAAVVVPKAEPEHLQFVRRIVGDGVPLLPIIESVRGFWDALASAKLPGIGRLLFGSIDFQVDLGATDDELLYYRSQLVLVSRIAGIAAPSDGVTPSIDDLDAVRRDAERARKLGYTAKICIHPAQVAVVHAAFQPSAEDVAWARRIIAADAAAGGAAVAVDGKMLDRPILLKAQSILADLDPGQ